MAMKVRHMRTSKSGRGGGHFHYIDYLDSSGNGQTKMFISKRTKARHNHKIRAFVVLISDGHTHQLKGSQQKGGGTLQDANPRMMENSIKRIAGGFLLQDGDSGKVEEEKLKIVTERHPNDRELKDLLIAYRIAKHVKSNAIVYVKDGASVGIGAGQMSRVDASRIAASKAKDASRALGREKSISIGSVVASDAFFPFADGLFSAIEAGATAVIQPGGSIKDQEVINAANEKEIAMVMTGIRNFRH